MENSTDNKNIKVDNKKKIDNTHDDLSNSMASVGQLSEMHHQRTAVDLKSLQKTYNYLLFAFLPLALGVLVMASMWSDIAG